METFYSRCVSHVSSSYQRFVVPELERIGLSLSQFVYDPVKRPESGRILHKVQTANNHSALIALDGETCELPPAFGLPPSGLRRLRHRRLKDDLSPYSHSPIGDASFSGFSNVDSQSTMSPQRRTGSYSTQPRLSRSRLLQSADMDLAGAMTNAQSTVCELTKHACSHSNGGCHPLRECIHQDGQIKCGPCPPGYHDDASGAAMSADGLNLNTSVACVNVNECDQVPSPCWTGNNLSSQCTDRVPTLQQARRGEGFFECSACPLGMIGNGLATMVSSSRFNGCHDIDECAINNGECLPAEQCVNNFAAASTCVVCPEGFTGADCATDIDECASGPCKFGGRCYDSTSSDSVPVGEYF
eukprot:SAG31_NODE_5119_length_2726_cov_5.271967_2_plen_356_part_01